MLLFVNVVLCCVAAIQVAHALPHVKRIVIDPHITSPDPATVWTPGNDELVMWYDHLRHCPSMHSLPTLLLGIPPLYRLRGITTAHFSLAT